MNNYEKANKSIETPIKQLVAGRNAVKLQDNRPKTTTQLTVGKMEKRTLGGESVIQLTGNKQSRQSQRNQIKAQRAQQEAQNKQPPKKSARKIRREEEKLKRRNANRGYNTQQQLEWYHYFMMGLMLSSIVHGANATGTNKSHTYDNDHPPYPTPQFLSGNSTIALDDHFSPVNNNNLFTPSINKGPGTSLIHIPTPVNSTTTHSPSDLFPVKTKQNFAEMPTPSGLHLKSVRLNNVTQIGQGAGASKGSKAESVDFKIGKKWGKTFLKDADANFNTDNSTVRASVYNSGFLRSMGVAVPEIEPVKTLDSDKIQIASKGIGKYEGYKELKDKNLNEKQRSDYVKLALLSPVADLHENNFGLIDGKRLGTIDVDTALPMHSHNYRRLIDRFKLDPHGYKTNDMSGSYLGDGKIQDFVSYDKIAIKEADVFNAVKDFCAIPLHDLANQLEDYPLQGKASQKLTLHSLRTQQQMLKEAFKDFQKEPPAEIDWVNSTSYKALEEVIERYERENQFPYSFKVLNKDKLEITVNQKFNRKKGTGFWNDSKQEATNPQLLKAIEAGHLGDANLRMTSKTNINPADIPKMISAAGPYLRSIGAGNPGVGFIVKLIHHPSFNKMSNSTKGEVKKLFANRNSPDEEANPFRQVLFPKNEVVGKFKLDSFYAGGSDKLKEAVRKIKNL